MQRGGFPFRTIVLALFVVGTVYLLYLYNTTLGRLRDAELTAERYRREEETKTAQLQGVMRSKDELQEKCDSEKREFTNRLNSLNQQHKMLKSQNDEHEVEQMRLEQETRRLREDFDQVEQQRNQEYQALKAEKELEVSSLKDQVANYQRQNEQLQTQITSLREQLQNGQSQVEYDRALIQKMEQDVAALQHQLAVKSAQLVQQGQGQAMQHGQGQGQAMLGQGQAGFGVNQQLNFNNAQQQGILQQQQLNQQHQQQLFGQGLGQQEGVANMNIGAAGGNNMAFQQQQQQDGLNVGQAQGGLNQEEQQEALDNVNQQHQMVPPNNPAIPDAPVNGNVDGRPMHQQEVVVKDEDHQVQPPNFNADVGAKDGSREGAGAGGMLGAADEQHKDPLALQQIVQPNVGDHGEREMEGEEKEKDEDEEDDNIMRQVPPVNDVKFGHNAAEEEEEEEEGDHYRDDDKYEDDARDDGGNNNVHINQNPNNIPDADYA